MANYPNKQATLFPELDAELSSNLYIVGNGFDIMHGLPTRYADFREWLIKNGDKQFVDLLNLLFPYAPDDDDNDNNYFWSDIENFLGEYRPHEIMDFCVPNGMSYKDGQKYVYAVEDGPNSIFIPALNHLFEKFKEWVDSIDVTSFCKIHLHPECLYLTFNYTETLEKIYGIPDEQVCHIHGKRKVDEEYVFGHNNLISSDQLDADYEFERKALCDIVSEMNAHVKDYNGIMKFSEWFFRRISKIKRIIVIGHSMGKIDLPYFDKLIEMAHHDIEWLFYYHSEDDLKNIIEFVDSRNIRCVKYKNI